MAIKPIKKAISEHYKIKVHSIGLGIGHLKPKITPNGEFKVHTIEVYERIKFPNRKKLKTNNYF